MEAPDIHLHLDLQLADSCNCCLRCKNTDSYYLNSRMELEPWSRRKATPDSASRTEQRIERIIRERLQVHEVMLEEHVEEVKKIAFSASRQGEIPKRSLQMVAEKIMEINRAYEQG